MPKIKLSKLIMAVVIAIALIAIGWYFLKPEQQPTQYITAEVTQEILKTRYWQQVYWKPPKWSVSVPRFRVRLKNITLGDQVKQGQLIARIDSVRQENDLKTAEASIKTRWHSLP